MQHQANMLSPAGRRTLAGSMDNQHSDCMNVMDTSANPFLVPNYGVGSAPHNMFMGPTPRMQ